MINAPSTQIFSLRLSKVKYVVSLLRHVALCCSKHQSIRKRRRRDLKCRHRSLPRALKCNLEHRWRSNTQKMSVTMVILDIRSISCDHHSGIWITRAAGHDRNGSDDDHHQMRDVWYSTSTALYELPFNLCTVLGFPLLPRLCFLISPLMALSCCAAWWGYVLSL